MTYQYIPNPGDLLSNSQADIKSNFTIADNVMNVDHFPFTNATSNKGKHKYVRLPATTLPAPNVLGEGTVFTYPQNGQTQLYYTPDAGGNNYQLTRCVDSNVSRFGNSTAYASGVIGGWVFIPGGLILNYGIVTLPANPTAITIPFAQAYSGGVFSITLGNMTSDASTTAQQVRIITGSVTLAQFQLRQSSSSSANSCYFTAIGT